MTAPGVIVTTRATQPGVGAFADTGVWFVVGAADRGPSDEAIKVTNLAEYVARFGERSNQSSGLYDSLETFFREGGARAYVTRLVGPDATFGVLGLNDRGAGAGAGTLLVTAADPGEYAGDITVEVEDGEADDTFVLTIRYLGVVVEQSPELASPSEAVEWSSGSAWVEITDTNSPEDAPDDNPRVLEATGLASNVTDDIVNVTAIEVEASLNLFGADLGPGQVSVPGWGAVVADVNAAMVAHAVARNRTAILDVGPTDDAAAMTTLALTVRDLPEPERAGIFGPWLRIPGVVPGTTRTVPASAAVAGLLARGDRVGGTNVPAAGAAGVLQFVLGAVTTFTDDERDALNQVGVNVVRQVQGTMRLYGFRTPSENPTWRSLADQRLRMEIAARADVIGESYVFARIDPRGRKIAEYGGALTGLLAEYYNADALYGLTPDEAFSVNVGSTVNTEETIAAGELRAVLSVIMSPFAEVVEIEVVKAAIGEPVA